MNEQYKIEEASYFLTRFPLSISQPKEFSFELSAFLSAARSVLQFAYDETKTKPGSKAWYENQMQNKVVKYFRDKRNMNIHAKPVVPQQHINVSIGLRVPVQLPSIAIHLKVTDQNGNVIHEHSQSSPEPEHRPEPTPSQSVTFFYHFDDWKGTEDVETLCDQYLAAIEAIVRDGQAKGFLSP